jgi:tetratricopeptide (TPR) repeat protein
MHTASMTGDLRTLDATSRLVSALMTFTPGPSVPTWVRPRWWTMIDRVAMGVPFASVRQPVDSGLAEIDRMTDRAGAGARRQSLPVPYVAFLATRDLRYAAIFRRWLGASAQPWHELDAMEALAKGDSARARALTAQFPSPDSMRASGANQSAMRWIMRAEVLAALGDTRRALAMYEVLDPKRFGDPTPADPGLALYARSVLARARLYEQLGQRDSAAASYERFVTWWKDADPSLVSQAREARAGLARVRDAGAATSVR